MAMDERTRKALHRLMNPPAEEVAQREREKDARDKMVARLEKKYASRGLKFTVPFQGAVPVQAYGRIDGLRFYFRFRGNWASIKAGPVDPVFEKRYADRQRESYMERHKRDKNRSKDDLFGSDYWLREANRVKPQTDQDKDFYPHRVVKAAGCEGPIPGDKYNGFLAPEEAYTIFSKLVDHLQDIPEDQQVDQHTKDWLANKNT